MKRPEKIVMWLPIKKDETEWVNHLGKPLYKYSIELPSWIGLAYNPYAVKVEIRQKTPCFLDRKKESNDEETMSYVKSNWMRKLAKMRKLNHNYMTITTIAKARIIAPDGGFV